MDAATYSDSTITPLPFASYNHFQTSSALYDSLALNVRWLVRVHIEKHVVQQKICPITCSKQSSANFRAAIDMS
ncbi:hypothetical protein DD237_007648 [Peronospora effusa]|uniref:Uncharacterized protein n=1 Tax=Peronospora effusa TaxID=542832 RepID=A0A3R7W5N0_9STRA|nr:hypothetical protein DD237_007648 [Peronospora effusa]